MMIEKANLTLAHREIEPVDFQFKNDQTNTASSSESSQFEAIYLQTLLKSSCIDQHFVNNTGLTDGIRHDSMYLRVPRDVESMPLTSASPGTDVEFKPNEQITLPVSHAPVYDTMDHRMDEFVVAIWPYAQKASMLIGLDPKLLIAQVALETGWGQFIAKDLDGVSSHNLFNIKSKDANHDDAVRINTTEYINDIPVKTIDSFKKYLSFSHSFDDYISLIKGSARYHTALSQVHDPEAYVNALHVAGYATDPEYAKKILSIYHGNELNHALNRAGILC